MGWFGFGKRRKTPLMFKCIICQKRGADTYHFELPVCSSCKVQLNKRIEADGGAIQKYLQELKQLWHKDGEQETPDVSESMSKLSESTAKLSEEIARHAARLVPYEELRLRTSTPEPTEIIRMIHAREVDELEVQLFVSE